MVNISQLITAIETCRADAGGMMRVCAKCPYRHHVSCISDMKEDIITVLKSYMPHVLSPNEVEALPRGAIIYAEIAITKKLIPMERIGNDFTGINSDEYFLLGEITECPDYGVNYRFWLGEPSIEYRNTIPWEKNKYDNE